MLKRYTTAVSLIFTLLFSSLAATAQAPQPQEKVDLDVVAKIKEEGLQRSQVMDLLSYMTDVHGPRLTASPQYKAAAEWAKQKLASWGLQNAHLEAWGPFGRGWSLEGFTISMVEPDFSPIIAYPKAWSPSVAARGKVVYLDAKTEADLDKYKGKLKGAIVLIAPPRPVKAHFEPEATRQTDKDLLAMADFDPASAPQRQFRFSDEMRAAMALTNKKLELCASEGAAVVLEPGRGDGGNLFVQSATIPQPVDTPREQRRSPWAKDAPPIVPQIVVAVEHYNRLIRMLARNATPTLDINLKTRYHDQDLMGYNVIAEIPGADPALKDEIVMVGGHYDSWHGGTGATDNAAGSAVAMEVMRIIQTLGLKPRRTIRIGLWGGEEQGLHGSRQHVAQHYGKRAGGSPDNPQFELKPAHEKFSVYFNLDNGTGKIRGVYLQGNEAARPIFRTWLAPFKDMGATTLTSMNTGGTDHLAFDAVGLPGFQFIQDEIEYDTRTHHSTQDVYDRIQEDDMKQAAVIIASFAYHAAMRDKRLPRKPLPGQPVVQSGK
ncbi:MAG TPA: M20/M25/M40 family metallo-hydrolase [Blastocatellia bacterium]|nr:M20/M25/M40 family metallo-hydrolase [Blastocatellia bacterium]